ncbi:unnamed protein product [Dibothriocephalus latus]|uniref:Uncharacterized protein n=1 Tax=Dibothriocephalus latus TaxID=60516 RepID=A0A3P7LFV5_DIBLA|nr:unnamed protein product [Dibothriocephalus latus]
MPSDEAGEEPVAGATAAANDFAVSETKCVVGQKPTEPAPGVKSPSMEATSALEKRILMRDLTFDQSH